MTTERAPERAPESAFPGTLEHKHGLDEWSPMLPERSAETIEPGKEPTEQIYRCQKIGCTEVIRIGASEVQPVRAPEATTAG
jgi:hypothetical protein